MYNNQIERGKLICEGLAWYGITGDWVVDIDGELLLLIDKKIYRCLGKHSINKETLPYWGPVEPTLKSLYDRQLGARKLSYTPLYINFGFNSS